MCISFRTYYIADILVCPSTSLEHQPFYSIYFVFRFILDTKSISGNGLVIDVPIHTSTSAWNILLLSNLWDFPNGSIEISCTIKCCTVLLPYMLATHRVPSCAQIATFMGPTWGPPVSCRPQMGPMLAPWTLLSRTCFSSCVMQSLWADCFAIPIAYNL